MVIKVLMLYSWTSICTILRITMIACSCLVSKCFAKVNSFYIDKYEELWQHFEGFILTHNDA